MTLRHAKIVAASVCALSILWGTTTASADDAAVASDSARAVAPPVQDTASVAVVIRKPSHPGLLGRTGRAAGNFFSDGWEIVKAPFDMSGAQLLGLGAVLGTAAVLYTNDEEILNAIVRNRDEPVLRSVVNVGQVIEPIGFMGNTNPYYAGALVLGYATRVEPLRTIPTEILESHLLAGGIRNLGKLVVGRRHPYDHLGRRSFEFAHGTSFPSGHTSVYFELATIASAHAHFLPVTIAAYSLATAGAIQRVESLNHWPSDVFVAACYGTFVARTVVRLHDERTMERRLGVKVDPWVTSEGQVAGLRVSRAF